jgi:hypothetical protein
VPQLLMTMDEQIQRALSAAGRFLVERQSADGAWRSNRYGNFKDGDALTPLALFALCQIGTHELRSGIATGAGYLAALASPHGLTYPVYSAALAVMALSHPACPLCEEARTSWLTFLRQRQLTEKLGWRPEDKEYGGWGYSQDVPTKLSANTVPLVESNLSATAFALDALNAAGCHPDEPVFSRALVFVKCCQNFPDDPDTNDPAFDDGGFFFMENDSIRNKAGVAGVDRSGRLRFHSYGSMTADGLRSLLACGVSRDDPRVTAACQWLGSHWSVTTHPGTWASDRRHVQASISYYWLWVLAMALAAHGPTEIPTPSGPVRWAESLAEELLRRQNPKGNWSNEDVEVREDEPIVATALAVAALAVAAGAIDR